MAALDVSLEQAREAPLEFSGKVPIAARDLDVVGLDGLEPVDVRGEVSFDGVEFLVRGSVGMEATLECSRCLSPFPFSESSEFDLRLLPRPESGDKASAALEDPDVFFHDGETAPIDEIVREQVLMLLPMKPLCREDCRGLCATCGKDLNAGPCACEAPAGDPRFAVLRGLK